MKILVRVVYIIILQILKIMKYIVTISKNFIILLRLLAAQAIKGGVNYDESDFSHFSYFNGRDSVVLS